MDGITRDTMIDTMVILIYQRSRVSACLDRLLKLQETMETKEKETDTTEAEELMMNGVVYLNEKDVIPRELETNND